MSGAQSEHEDVTRHLRLCAGLVMFEIDLKTRIIEADDRLFVLFPGKGHRFYNDFAQSSNAFLDLPGLGIEDLRVVPQAQPLAKLLARSARIRSWHAQGRDPARLPERDLAQYADRVVPKTRVQLAGAARDLYFGLRKGELILVPGPGYFSDVLVGEIADDPASGATAEVARYPDEKVPARAVRWLARIPK